ncbi:MAG TPA: adenosylcobinamide-GDP ribazoletransferase [Terriglobales bacterium]|nr:adenosylcobinamide-GDP ribazoletransferase [Terriglobales bacterium]
MIRILQDMATAFQFLTRLPLGRLPYDENALSRSAKFFPLVGLLIGIFGSVAYLWFIRHLPSAVAALLTLALLVLATGGLHEDGLADVADAFGGGWSREQILAILKDSSIGTFGTVALVVSVGLRVLLLANLPLNRFAAYVISGHVLCRWTALPLGYVLPAARESSLHSQGSRIARQISAASLAIASLFALILVAYALRRAMWSALAATLAVTLLSGLYYWRRIGGVTGDCFGATNQLAEIAVYLCGVWHP